MKTFATFLVLFMALLALAGAIAANFACPWSMAFTTPLMLWTGRESAELIAMIWK